MRGTAGIFSIITTRAVIHLVKGTPDAIVALRIVLIVCRMALPKTVCSCFVSLLPDTKRTCSDRVVCTRSM